MNASPPETAPGPPLGPADHELFRSCLEQVVASSAFSGARRQQRFLRYLVERTIAGDTTALKEYSLGIEVFERGAEFDPRLDPIVRVEASRLRNRLQKYYQSSPPGISHRIELPRGGYVPVLAAVQDAAPDPGPEPAPPPPARRRWLYPAAALVILLLVVGAALLLRRPEAPFGHFTRLSRELGRATAPSLSPDGKWVVYAARIDGDWEILLRSSDGHALRNLSLEPRFADRHPAFSPDGRQVAFQSARGGGGFYVVPVEGGPPRRVAPRGNHPTWAPDGTRLAYCTGSFDEPGEDAPYRRSSIGIVDLKSGAITEWSSPGEVHDALQPAWSADGAWIAFWGHDHTGQVDLWTLPVALPAGREATRVLSDPFIDWSPRFSPDGAWLYYSSNRSGPMSLWRVRFQRGAARGAPEPVVTPSSNSGWVTLSSDGRRLAYVRRLNYSRLFRAPFDPVRGVLTGDPVALTSGERRFREPSLSPDGAWLAAHTQDPQDDIVLLKPDGSGLRRLTDDAHLDRIPLWAPDGHSLVFYSTRGGALALWLIQADGSGLRQLCPDGHATPLWLPDGTLLAVPEPPGLPVVLSPPGRAIPAALTVNPGVRPIAVAPDGLHFAARISGDGALAVCPMAGGDCWRVGPHISSPVWIRGGQALLFFSGNAFHLADLATRTIRLFYQPANAELHPRLATDGHSLFFAQREDDEDVWIAERAPR